eukprot:SAG31_NODE_595_length_13695_cov_11.446896_17_plen_77_part_00
MKDRNPFNVSSRRISFVEASEARVRERYIVSPFLVELCHGHQIESGIFRSVDPGQLVGTYDYSLLRASMRARYITR